ncbi:hypothetical protein MTR67_019167 [Solanum verrucosum]|uniref:Uncharacterized protein n=1 Tax=Solanum verrucosum TaxID=315347 RepID=A0AAF0QL11_SOLVR|nr:hypothetical protein MTR67_019167 [Solanum verrucosum]
MMSVRRAVRSSRPC